MTRSSCGAPALYKSPKGDFVFGRWHCGATLKCAYCAKKRAARLLAALSRVNPPDMKLCHLTVTFAPGLNVTMQNVAKKRHAVLEYLRRRLSPRLLEYVCVVERHKSGKPHLHIAIYYPTVRALQRDGRDAVQGSHVRAKLVASQSQVTYIAKYVGKQSSAKLTSSRNVARLANEPSSGWELISVKPDSLTFEQWNELLDLT